MPGSKEGHVILRFDMQNAKHLLHMCYSAAPPTTTIATASHAQVPAHTHGLY
jgi:hypothetical protein